VSDRPAPPLPQTTLEILRREESDRFLSALFAPTDLRAPVMALYALDRELKRIPHLVSEPMLGAIRFQWWRDAIGAIYQGEESGHEIGPALAHAIEVGNLPPEAFHAWLDAREDEMAELPFSNMEAMTAHARASDGTIMNLAAQVLSDGHPAAEPLGTAYGLMDLLRRCGAAAGRRAAFLPADMLGDDDMMLFAGDFTPKIATAFASVCAHTSTCFEASAKDGRNAGSVLPALLPAGLIPGYMRLMAKRHFNPLRTQVEVPAFRRQIALLARATRGRI